MAGLGVTKGSKPNFHHINTLNGGGYQPASDRDMRIM
jgi:hypothetical protein